MLCINQTKQSMFDGSTNPMPRHLPQPLYSAILHRRIGVESLRYSVGNERGALLLQQFDQAFLLGDQGVDFGGFVVEESGDGGLFIK